MLLGFFGSLSTSNITGEVVSVDAISTSTATASVSFLNTGKQTTTVNSSTAIQGDWVTPPSSAAEWEIRATLNSGVTPSGTFGSWLPLNTSRTWSLSSSAVGSLTSNITFEFRRVGSVTIEATLANNTLLVEVLDGFR